ncbi:hypothetical protein [Marivirga sp.]|uniref:hypothetical protein n=1 Tax=Marivirga sp. TaxID=2018662 RepID=UPI003DA73E0C
MQKPDSFFLSTTGIRHYKENFPEVNKHLNEIFLCVAWHLEEETIQIKEIAHNLRNNYHNNKGRNYNQIRLPFYEDTLKKFN